MKKENEHSPNQQERMGESLKSRLDKAENRTSYLEDSNEKLESSNNAYKIK